MGTPRLQVLVAAYPEFAEFQILPCLYLFGKHATVVVAGPDRRTLHTEGGLNVVPDASWDDFEQMKFGIAVMQKFGMDVPGRVDYLRGGNA